MKALDEQSRYNIEQVTATMTIEDMPPDIRTIENLKNLAVGAKTSDQIINEIKKEYENGQYILLS